MPRSVIHPLQVSFCLLFLPLPSIPLESWDLLLGFSFPPASAHGSFQIDLKYSHFSTPDLEFLFTATGSEVEGRVLPLEHTLEEWKII